ncbi:MAG: ABC transporter ATP-binding protein [Dissulfurispiraceae bacterium]
MISRDTLLQLQNLSVSYGRITVVSDVSFHVYSGEIVTLIGANGAGKTSILRAISGMVPYNGSVIYEGQNLRTIPPHAIVAKGIAHVPEGRGIFGNLTVKENLLLASWQRKDAREIQRDYDYILDLFPRLKERGKQLGGTLSGGEQQMLAVARALMSKGKMLLLDEPSMGLSPLMVIEIFHILSRLNQENTTILLVEQNATMALNVASRGYVLEAGTITLSGTGSELAGNPLVQEAYLGA